MSTHLSDLWNPALTSKLPLWAAWTQSEARLPADPTCPCDKQCPRSRQHYFLDILVAVRADWLKPGMPGLIHRASNAFTCAPRTALCFSKLQAVCLTGSWKALKHVNKVGRGWICPQAQLRVTSAQQPTCCYTVPSTDTYLKGPLYNQAILQRKLFCQN